MIFAIDIGNTNIVLGCIDKDTTYFTERLSTDHSKTDFEYAVMFQSLLQMRQIQTSSIEGCIISSVVPPVAQIVKRAAERVLKCNPIIIGPGIKTGLNILIDNPAQLGADMVVGAVAAIEIYQNSSNEKLPLILFDIGTATTVSVINKNGGFLGGMILPGPKVALESLSQGTAQLPLIDLSAPKKVIGKNTIDCMRSGIIYGNASCMDGLIDRIENELDSPALSIATGGLARYLIPYTRHSIIYNDDLLLKGLYLIYQKNR